MKKPKAKTEFSELVETHKLALSLKRLEAGSYGPSWRRSLYHALQIAGVDNPTMAKIREALVLP